MEKAGDGVPWLLMSSLPCAVAFLQLCFQQHQGLLSTQSALKNSFENPKPSILYLYLHLPPHPRLLCPSLMARPFTSRLSPSQLTLDPVASSPRLGKAVSSLCPLYHRISAGLEPRASGAPACLPGHNMASGTEVPRLCGILPV